MPRRVRYRCSIRQFLNRPGHHGKAAIIASVEDTSRLNPEELRYPRPPAIYLNISDCSRHVTLSFDVNTREEQANAMYKINTLLSTLVRFRDALVAEIQLHNKRQSEYQKRHRQPTARTRTRAEPTLADDESEVADADQVLVELERVFGGVAE
jgi:hypothetical protein